jgi:hypothetical protein
MQSGRRYTPSTIIDSVYHEGNLYLIGPSQTDKPYSKLSDIYSLVDIRLYKDLFLGRDHSLRFFIEIENLFDNRIPNYVNPYTGKPYDPGEPISYYYLDKPNPNFDPSRYRKPRTILMGILYRF